MIRSSTNLCSACRPLQRLQPITTILRSPLRTTTRSFNSISIQQAAASRRTVGLKSKKVFKRPTLSTSLIENEKEVGTVVGDGSTAGADKVTSSEKEGNTATTPEVSYPWNAYNASPPIPSSSTLVSESSPSSTDITPSEPEPIPVALIPVQVPHDPHGVLDLSTSDWSVKARRLLAVSGIVVVRQLEMMNVLLGYEEANKYQLLSPEGVLLGYLMEQEVGMKGMVMRQMLKTHRAFKATVLDIDGEVILRIRRPFSFINSRIYVTAPSNPSSSRTPSSSSPPEISDQETIIGEAQQEWHLYRRKYNHFVKRGEESVQFGVTDSGLMAWDFEVRNESKEVIGSINRNFAGFGRELFTDTGQYVLRFEGVASEQLAIAEAAKPTSEALPPPPLSTAPSPSPPKSDLTITSNTQTSPSTNDSAIVPSSDPTDILSFVPALSIPSITYDQRAVMLGAAVSIDIDYFTRSRGGVGGMGMGMFMPFPMGMGGGGGGAAAEGGVAEGAAIGGLGSLGEESGPGGMSTGDDEFGIGRDSGNGAGENGGEAGGWGMGNDDALMQDDAPMEDPWASEPQVGGGDEGTWSWGDLFPDE